MKKKHITIHDIAKQLNITASTVSRALNDNPRISEATRTAVKSLAIQLNYHPNFMASNLRKGKGNFIGVVVPRIDRHFFSNVIGGIENIVNSAGYNVIICQTNDLYEKEVENIKALVNARVSGIFISLASTTKDYKHLKKIRENGIKLIFFDRCCDEVQASKVVLDDYEGAFKATEHLIIQGCKKIAYFSGPETLLLYRNRKAGYIGALQKYNIPVDKNFIIKDTITREKGYEKAKDLFSNNSMPDGLCAVSDYSALGAVTFFIENGVSIPEDLAVVGFSNEPYTSIMEPSLTTVEQFSTEMGKEVAKIFIQEIDEPSVQPSQIILKPKLIIRKSSNKIFSFLSK